MMEVLEFLESNPLIEWVRGSDSVLVYPTVLASHTIGMAFLVGTTSAIALRTLGFAPSLPLAPLERYFRVAGAGFWLSTLSGLLLLAGEATRFLTMPTFYIKLGSIAVAVVCVLLLRRTLFARGVDPDAGPVPARARVLAGTMLFFWAVATLAGRVTAYWSVTAWKTAGAFLVFTLIMFAAGRIAVRLWNASGRVVAEAGTTQPQTK